MKTIQFLDETRKRTEAKPLRNDPYTNILKPGTLQTNRAYYPDVAEILPLLSSLTTLDVITLIIPTVMYSITAKIVDQ